MPIYEYKCKSCGKESDHVAKYADRFDFQECPSCQGEAEYTGSLAGTHYGGERIVGDKRLIVSEKQLERGWRDKGTTGKEGGAGKVQYFHS